MIIAIAAAQVCKLTKRPYITNKDKINLGKETVDSYDAWCDARPQGSEQASKMAAKTLATRMCKQKSQHKLLANEMRQKFLGRVVPRWETNYQKLLTDDGIRLISIDIDIEDLAPEMINMVLSHPHRNDNSDEAVYHNTFALLPEVAGMWLHAWADGQWDVQSLPIWQGSNTETLTEIAALWDISDKNGTYYELSNAVNAVNALRKTGSRLTEANEH